MKKIVSLSMLCFLAPTLSIADELKVEFEFKKRPPYTALIYVDDKGASSDSHVDQKDKQFIKTAYVTAPASKIQFKNSDSMDHNIYANAPKSGVKFDIGLLTPGNTASIDNSHWKEDSVVRVGCKIHPKMKSYISNVATSSSITIPFDKKQKLYSSVLGNVNGDTQKFAIWMPGYDSIKITLAKGETKELEMIKKGKVKGTVSLTY